jgi:hypothetical protein
MWTHHQLVDDVFTFADLLDVTEYLDIKAKNEKVWNDYQAKKRN